MNRFCIFGVLSEHQTRQAQHVRSIAPTMVENPLKTRKQSDLVHSERLPIKGIVTAILMIPLHQLLQPCILLNQLSPATRILIRRRIHALQLPHGRLLDRNQLLALAPRVVADHPTAQAERVRALSETEGVDERGMVVWVEVYDFRAKVAEGMGAFVVVVVVVAAADSVFEPCVAASEFGLPRADDFNGETASVEFDADCGDFNDYFEPGGTESSKAFAMRTIHITDPPEHRDRAARLIRARLVGSSSSVAPVGNLLIERMLCGDQLLEDAAVVGGMEVDFVGRVGG